MRKHRPFSLCDRLPVHQIHKITGSENPSPFGRGAGGRALAAAEQVPRAVTALLAKTNNKPVDAQETICYNHTPLTNEALLEQIGADLERKKH